MLWNKVHIVNNLFSLLLQQLFLHLFAIILIFVYTVVVKSTRDLRPIPLKLPGIFCARQPITYFSIIKMVVKHKVEGYEAYLKLMNELEMLKKSIYVLFSGSLNDKGVSWCPDCVKAEPAIEEVVMKLPDSVIFVKVLVGNREFWKDNKCPFRLDKKVHLTSLPTVIKWNCPERLEGTDFNNKDIITMAFEEDL